MILLTKGPRPDPSSEWGFVVVGLGAALQHTPRAVTPVPPSVRTVPPDVALVVVIFVTEVVITVGIIGFGKVVKLFSSPYPVPMEFVA